MLEQIQNWRQQGFAIALDDYGSGYMGLGALVTLKPDIVKLDHLIIQHVDEDATRQAGAPTFGH